jgi:hypothetical protein
VHDKLQVIINLRPREGKVAGEQLWIKEKLGRALTVAMIAGGMVLTAFAVAAEHDPILEMARAQCIQEGMLQGFAGEALKNYVNACAATKRNVPRPDLKPFSADPAAC